MPLIAFLILVIKLFLACQNWIELNNRSAISLSVGKSTRYILLKIVDKSDQSEIPTSRKKRSNRSEKPAQLVGNTDPNYTNNKTNNKKDDLLKKSKEKKKDNGGSLDNMRKHFDKSKTFNKEDKHD
ncbi:hypothetical protein LCGC14_3136510 [marine sediment metagenome]|uniref:Uncharacterized protein n=1 Tax=marine sediment metagenome TaxID=412755 RepID=A0A0F8Y545_9ZZZZ